VSASPSTLSVFPPLQLFLALTCGLFRIATLLVTILALVEFRKDRGVGAISLRSSGGDDIPRIAADGDDALSIGEVTVAA